MDVPTENLECKIVGAAQKLFVQQGFEKTSMSDIAAAAGVNRTTLHYYFRTKEKMFQAVFGSIMRSFLPRIQLIFDEDMPIREKLSLVLDEYLLIFSASPDLPRFILSEIQRDVDHLLNTGRILHLDVYLSAIERVILDEMEKGNIRKMPIPIVLMTFMSQLTFPFLAKKLLDALFFHNEEEYTRFLSEWKSNILRQMDLLLTGPLDKEGDI